MAHDLSVNHYICGDHLSFPRFAAAVAEAGMSSVGVTRAAIAELGLAGLERCLKENGLGASSLNSAGHFTIGDPSPVKYSSRELIEAAASLKADVLCVISGGLGTPPLPVAEAHKRVRDGLEELAGHAADASVTLGLEPVYPGDILTKGCINSVDQGLAVVAPYDNVKLIVDLYHSWWDPGLFSLLRDQPDQIALVQVCNLKTRDGLVVGRDTLSAGDLDLSQIMPSLASSDYNGKLELELFDRDLDGREPATLIRQFPDQIRSYLEP
jgi:sugar phosphate isomerase/epimerase